MQLLLAQPREFTGMTGRNNATPQLNSGFNFGVKAG
jgi:hypothetical protein